MLRHVIRLTSVHEGVEDTMAFSTNLNLWLESFFNSPTCIHSTKDWGIVSISRQEADHVLTFHTEAKHLFNPADFAPDIQIKVVGTSVHLLLKSDVILPWLLAYYADEYMTYIYKLANIQEES